MEWLRGLPYKHRFGHLELSHGSPVQPEDYDYIFASEQARALLPFRDDLADVTFIGHSHLTKVFALSEDDAQDLIAMFEHVKGNDDEPIVLVPHVTRSEDAVLGRIIADELEFTELSGQNRNTTASRRYATQFTVGGVWQR